IFLLIREGYTMAEFPFGAPGEKPPEFPLPHFPTVFADGVMSAAHSTSVVKYYLFRWEPEFAGHGNSKPQAFAQVIMPMEGFAAMSVFFEKQLAEYVKLGLVSEAQVSRLRATS